MSAKYVKGQEGTVKVQPVRQSMRENTPNQLHRHILNFMSCIKNKLLKFDYPDDEKKMERYKKLTQVH